MNFLALFLALRRLQPGPTDLTLFQDSGNKVSRRSFISGTANITLGGKTVIQADVQLRGDLHPNHRSSSSRPDTVPTSISIGRCTVVSTGCIIKPPCRIKTDGVQFYPMKIGDNVFIGKSTHSALISSSLRSGSSSAHLSPQMRKFGLQHACAYTYLYAGPNSQISSISISSHVHIGPNCILHPFSIVKENVKILPNTVVPANMVIPSGSIVAGQPARVVGEIAEGWGVSGGGGVGGGPEWTEGGDLRELVRSIR